MDQALYEKVRDYVFAHKDDVMRDLFDLVRIPSVKGAPAPGAPFGEDCLAALERSVGLFRENGFGAQIKEGGLYGLAYYGDGASDLGIFAHTDVVGVNDDWLYCPPFEPVILGETLFGRGVEDNKAGVIGALYALKAIKELELPMKHRAVVFLGTEEESGMSDIEAFVRNEPMPRVSFVPDNAYPLCVGEKSILHTWIKSTQPMPTVVDIQGGFAYNVILDQIKITLYRSNVLKEEILRRIKGESCFTLEEVEDRLYFTAKGTTAHASIPQQANNAAVLAFDILKEIPVFTGAECNLFSSAADFIRYYNGEKLGIGVSDPVFGKLTAANGMVKMQDGFLYISFDIRYGAEIDDGALMSSLERTCRHNSFAVVDPVLDKGTLVDQSSPVIDALTKIYREVSGDAEAKPYLSGGGTYARKLKNAFSIGTAAPWRPIDVVVPEGCGGAHQSEEAISLPGLLEAIALNVMFILEGDALTD